MNGHAGSSAPTLTGPSGGFKQNSSLGSGERRSLLARLIALRGAGAYTPHGLGRPHVPRRIQKLRWERRRDLAFGCAAAFTLIAIVLTFLLEAHVLMQGGGHG